MIKDLNLFPTIKNNVPNCLNAGIHESNSYAMVCPLVRGDNPKALALIKIISFCNYVQ